MACKSFRKLPAIFPASFKRRGKSYRPAEFNLGLAYFRGAGVTRDLAQALKWFEKAAKHGSLEARRNLNVLKGTRELTSGQTDDSAADSLVPHATNPSAEPFR
jgi:TPR repeat protein